MTTTTTTKCERCGDEGHIWLGKPGLSINEPCPICTPTQEDTTMKLAALDPNSAQDHWMEVHKAGCADTTRRGKRVHWTFDAATLTEAAEEVASDFLDEGSMTIEDALADIHFAPCVTLPVR
jgi:hypothetical protein